MVQPSLTKVVRSSDEGGHIMTINNTSPKEITVAGEVLVFSIYVNRNSGLLPKNK